MVTFFESLLAPFGGDVVGQIVVALRSCDMGFGSEDAVLAAFFVGSGDGFDFGFEFGFVSRRGRGEAEDGLGVGSSARQREQGES